jgi:MFS family permease
MHHYLLGTASWFTAFGIQGVMFAWLVTMVLRESPEMVGLAQMTLLLPGTLLMLIGGTYADRFGGRRIVIGAQSLAACAPLLLLVLIWSDMLTYASMLVYAVFMGCATAFVTPARDGLLNEIAEGRVQRAVMLASMIQFGGQMIGFTLAAGADLVGPLVVLGAQSLCLALGVLAFVLIPRPHEGRHVRTGRLLTSLAEGARTVFSSASMRLILVQNVAMAIFFMGSYVVAMPLLVREVFDGTARDLAFTNGSNSLGLVLSIVLMLRLGDVTRQGRALVLSQLAGGLMLIAAALMTSFALYVLMLFIWGACGGIAMTMARTIMQEQAPDAQRSRVMSFYALSFMGAGPLGALFTGFMVELLGPQHALVLSGSLMAVVACILAVGSNLWSLRAYQVASA